MNVFNNFTAREVSPHRRVFTAFLTLKIDLENSRALECHQEFRMSEQWEEDGGGMKDGGRKINMQKAICERPRFILTRRVHWKEKRGSHGLKVFLSPHTLGRDTVSSKFLATQ